jgi:pimeloyl-ACP methyl ester carboxylesterase
MLSGERNVQTGDGRTLRVLEAGDPGGRPVFFLHGTPGCRFLFADQVEDARRQGLRLIGHDRAGYGGSSPNKGRRIVDEAADVTTIANSLGIDRFAVYGWSGGGAPTLACAARLPDRVVGASSIAGVAPYPSEGLDWLAGTGELNVDDFNLMLSDQPAWEAKTAREAAMMAKATPEELREYLSSLLSEVDRAALTGRMVDFLVKQMREGLRSGISGPVDDSLSTAKPWGFELPTIRVPSQIWHGKHDKFVPFSHGEWLASRLPRAEHHLEPSEGHISMFINRVPSIHKWLASRF